jgi:hypothetical protein
MQRTGVISSDLHKKCISLFLGCQVRCVVGSERMTIDFVGYRKGDLGNSERKNNPGVVSDLFGLRTIWCWRHDL